jgi:lysophospholipase L1-like esterase
MTSTRYALQAAVAAAAAWLAGAAVQPAMPIAADPATGASAAAPGKWVGTWATAPSGKVDNNCRDCTIRNVVHTSIGGRRIRIHLANTFGTAPLVVAHTTAALPAVPGTAQVAPGTLREVTFGGHGQLTIPAGDSVTSDPVDLDVPADHDLLVTTFTPGYSTPMTFHPGAQQNSFFTTGLDAADATSAGALPRQTQAWHFLTGVDVSGAPAPGAVVAFGDSITDGYRSQMDVDHRWPNFLAGRLLRQPPGRQLAVMNSGIGGNRVLLDGGDGFGPSALSRFQRDVLDRTGIRSVIILEGINDIQQTPHQLDPAQITAGLRQLVDRAHARGLRVIGGTLTPFKGWYTYDAQEEAAREGVNNWIRTSGVLDGVADFDAAVRDSADPHRMLPLYDCGDHLHPNDLGYAAMADVVDLSQL